MLPAPAADLDATRTRLLEAAGEVFASHGYQHATVRGICARAGANVAAVNYHFRDKMGLYLEVLRSSLSTQENPAPEFPRKNSREALRLFIHGMLTRMYAAGQRGDWHLKIMSQEMARPTEALPRVVAEIMAPRYLALRRIVSQVVGLALDHDTTRLCAHSIISQVVHYAHAAPAIACLWPELKMTPERLGQIADHITDFSLASLRSIARKQKRNSR